MLDKLGGVFAPRPSPGPHKLRESLPLVIMLRNKLKYALTKQEVFKIVMQRTIKVDGKVRTDITFPTGFMGKWSTSTGHIFIYCWWCLCHNQLAFISKKHLNLNIIGQCFQSGAKIK